MCRLLGSRLTHETKDAKIKMATNININVEAKRAGETVFYLSDYLKKQMPVQDALKSDDIPTA